MVDFRWELVERRVAVDLVICRLEVARLVRRVAGVDQVGAHRPDAHALLPPRIDIARELHRHLGVGGMQAAAVLVVKPRLAADENLPERPFGVGHGGCGN